MILLFSLPGMNAAVRAVVRMGIYVKAKVYFVYEVSGFYSFSISFDCI